MLVNREKILLPNLKYSVLTCLVYTFKIWFSFQYKAKYMPECFWIRRWPRGHPHIFWQFVRFYVFVFIVHIIFILLFIRLQVVGTFQWKIIKIRHPKWATLICFWSMIILVITIELCEMLVESQICGQGLVLACF